MVKFQDKERILMAAREKKEVTYKGALIRLAADFSTETLQARWEYQETFQVMKNKGIQPRVLYPSSPSIKMEGQMRSFPDKRSLKEYTSCKPTLQEILKGLLYEVGKKGGTQVCKNGNASVPINNNLKRK